MYYANGSGQNSSTRSSKNSWPSETVLVCARTMTNEAFALPEKWGGRNCLIPVDVEVIRDIKAAMGGDSLLSFVSADC